MRGATAAFLAGAGVMATEILASRWLAPVFGFTLATWAYLISVTLLAGAIGAALGGRPTRRIPDRTLLGLAFSLAGLWISGDALVGPWCLDRLLDLPVDLGAPFAALALVGFPVLALGTVVPRAASLESGRTGSIVGRLLAASTAGSLAGTLLTALVLVPGTGLRTGGLLVGGALLAFGALTLPRGGARVTSALGLLATVVLAAFPADRDGPGFARETAYGRLELVPTPGGLSLRVDGIAQTGLSPFAAGRGSLLARRQYFELLPFLHPRGVHALHVGLGAGLVPRVLAGYGIRTTNIEIDPVLVELARERFGFQGEVIVGDGRAVLRRTRERYDFVILDAFRGETAAAHLLTREAFQEGARRLRPGGIVCIHLIARPAGRAVASVARTLASVLPSLLAARSGIGDEVQHVFLFAAEKPLRLLPHPDLETAGFLGNETFEPDRSAGALLTDDRNPLPGLLASAARVLRRASRRR